MRSLSRVEILARRVGLLLGRCYKRCFQDETGTQISEDGKRVLADLRRFARIGEPTFSVAVDAQMRMDPIKLARMEGRREVVYRILGHINLDEAAIQTFVEVSVDDEG